MHDSFPVLFPTKINQDTSYPVDILSASFSQKKGGSVSRSAVEQLSTVFTSLDKMDASETVLNLKLNQTVNCRMSPKKIYYSTNGFNIYRFNQISNNN